MIPVEGAGTGIPAADTLLTATEVFDFFTRVPEAAFRVSTGCCSHSRGIQVDCSIAISSSDAWLSSMESPEVASCRVTVWSPSGIIMLRGNGGVKRQLVYNSSCWVIRLKILISNIFYYKRELSFFIGRGSFISKFGHDSLMLLLSFWNFIHRGYRGKFISPRGVISVQILTALAVTRKTKKKIIKIGQLLAKWRQFAYSQKCYFCG